MFTLQSIAIKDLNHCSALIIMSSSPTVVITIISTSTITCNNYIFSCHNSFTCVSSDFAQEHTDKHSYHVQYYPSERTDLLTLHPVTVEHQDYYLIKTEEPSRNMAAAAPQHESGARGETHVIHYNGKMKWQQMNAAVSLNQSITGAVNNYLLC